MSLRALRSDAPQPQAVHAFYLEADSASVRCISGDAATVDTLASEIGKASPVFVRFAGCDRDTALAALREVATRYVGGESLPGTLMPPPPSDPEPDLLGLLEDYLAYLGQLERSDKHIRHTERHCRMAIEACSAKVPSELVAGPIRSWLKQMRDDGVYTMTTCNSVITSIKAFANWLRNEDIVGQRPLRTLRKGRVMESKKQKRALSDQEINRLFESLPNAPMFRYANWRMRRAIYAVALRSGLRAGELGSLAVGDLDFDQRRISIQAKHAKNRTAAMLPMHADVERLCRPFAHDRDPHDRLFPGSWWEHAAEMLRHDLHRAGIDPMDARGRVATFHSTRISFISGLARANVPIVHAQRLARHSTPLLTANVYTDVSEVEGAADVAKLPALPMAS